MAEIKHKIVPHLWYDKEGAEAANFYCSVFPDSQVTNITVLPGTPTGGCEIVSFTLSGQPFMAISAGPYFKFNESVSFIVYCDTQEEMDYYTNKLSAVPDAEQCGWIKDKYGLSWQIVSPGMDRMLQDKDAEKVARVAQVMMQMKRLDMAALQRAFDGE
jgi:predicted 3-demethylubiquinone-9 3-methyltransferase (glyoxalase superfamily)